jgi:hypothetical protein
MLAGHIQIEARTKFEHYSIYSISSEQRFVCKQLVPSFLLCPSAVPGRAYLGKSSPESGSVYSILTFRRTGGVGGDQALQGVKGIQEISVLLWIIFHSNIRITVSKEKQVS